MSGGAGKASPHRIPPSADRLQPVVQNDYTYTPDRYTYTSLVSFGFGTKDIGGTIRSITTDADTIMTTQRSVTLPEFNHFTISYTSLI